MDSKPKVGKLFKKSHPRTYSNAALFLLYIAIAVVLPLWFTTQPTAYSAELIQSITKSLLVLVGIFLIFFEHSHFPYTNTAASIQLLLLGLNLGWLLLAGNSIPDAMALTGYINIGGTMLFFSFFFPKSMHKKTDPSSPLAFLIELGSYLFSILVFSPLLWFGVYWLVRWLIHIYQLQAGPVFTYEVYYIPAAVAFLAWKHWKLHNSNQ